MFGDLFGNLEEQQKQMKERLAEVVLQSNAGEGAVTIEINGNLEVQNVVIDPSKLDDDYAGQLEDLFLVAMNRAITMAREAEQKEAGKLMGDMLPPGMDHLKNMF